MIKPLISIIILNFNGKKIINNCLKSLKMINYVNYRIIVVDNNSSDGSQSFITDNFPDVHLIVNDKNYGVSKGLNIGIKAALEIGSEYIFTLNNDIIVEKNILNELLQKYMKYNKIGILGPIMYWPNKSNLIQSGGGMIEWEKGVCYHKYTNQKLVKLPPTIEVDYVGLIFIKKEIIDKIGLFDESFFAYWEDVDICIRVKKLGYKVQTVSSAKVWHLGSFTTEKLGGFISYYSNRNRFWFMKKHLKINKYFKFIIYFIFYDYWLKTGFYLKNLDLKSLIFFNIGMITGIFMIKK